MVGLYLLEFLLKGMPLGGEVFDDGRDCAYGEIGRKKLGVEVGGLGV